MGAIGPGKLRRLFSPIVGLLGAGFLAVVVMLPTAAEARFHGRNLAISKECTASSPERGILRTVGPCKGAALIKTTMLPERITVSGKLGAALAAELYCRAWSISVSEFRRKPIAYLPYPVSHRIIEVEAGEAVEWPSDRCDPAPDTGMIGALWSPRPPDG
jgi:hypothetical protein